MDDILTKVKTLEISTKRLVTDSFSGSYRSNFHGSGIEVAGLRAYEYGDNARHIDWVTTAKLGSPFIKKYHETREMPTFIIVDVGLSRQFGSSTNTKKQVALEAAAIILFSALKNGDQVGAIIYNNTVTKYIPLRKGKKHVLSILRNIITAFENSNERVASNAHMALTYFNRITKKHPICFLLSDIDTLSEKLLKTLTVTHLRNDFVYVHIQDPFEIVIPDQQPNIILADMQSPANGEFSLFDHRLQKEYARLRQKKEHIRTLHLQKRNIDTLTLTAGEDTFLSFLHFFKRRIERTSRRF
jgi:uncharacterized protein (DUF58 family)